MAFLYVVSIGVRGGDAFIAAQRVVPIPGMDVLERNEVALNMYQQ